LPEAALGGDPAIVFTGAIYDAQAEALRRLVRALDRPELAGARLHLRSQLPPEIVAESGIEAGPRVTLAAASVEESLAAQRAADVLFLPIAFDANEAVRRTASPSKLPEYLAAGRPILVHAPPDAYVTRYAREHGFAEVVDVPDEAALAAAVRRLATDEALGAQLVAAARETLRRHEVPAVAERFRAALAPVLSR
jgi:glycosyltransferase involved in cell wall biosynthesis